MNNKRILEIVAAGLEQMALEAHSDGMHYLRRSLRISDAAEMCSEEQMSRVVDALIEEGLLVLTGDVPYVVNCRGGKS